MTGWSGRKGEREGLGGATPRAVARRVEGSDRIEGMCEVKSAVFVPLKYSSVKGASAKCVEAFQGTMKVCRPSYGKYFTPRVPDTLTKSWDVCRSRRAYKSLGMESGLSSPSLQPDNNEVGVSDRVQGTDSGLCGGES